jgi:hypothetical protein
MWDAGLSLATSVVVFTGTGAVMYIIQILALLSAGHCSRRIASEYGAAESTGRVIWGASPSIALHLETNFSLYPHTAATDAL